MVKKSKIDKRLERKKFFVNEGNWLFGVKVSKTSWIGLANPLKLNPLQTLGFQKPPKNTFSFKPLLPTFFFKKKKVIK